MRGLRSLLIGLLLAAVLLKPVLAFDCICPEHGPSGAVAATIEGGDDCCPGQDCHDGCAHATAVVSPEHALPLPPADESLSSSLVPACRPCPTPGLFRPPIAA